MNPIAEGADPYVVRDGPTYLWCRSDADSRIVVSRSDDLTRLGAPTVVWRAPAAGPWSAEVWAPELHRVDGRWHIYFAASDGDNRNHLSYVLVADTDDPTGSYTMHGPLATGDDVADPQWAIDLTVFEHDGTRYAVWSGWPDRHTPTQRLYIAPMDSPTTLCGPRVQLCRPDDHAWERIPTPSGVQVGEGLNEAPQILQRQGRTFLLYSASSALTASYTLGLLELIGADPLDPRSWRKSPEPLLRPTEETPGVGHGICVEGAPDQWWLVYHRKVSVKPGFERAVHVQPMRWSTTGEPVAAPPVAAGINLTRPIGPASSTGRDFAYFGHHQLLRLDDDGIRLGGVPRTPVNCFRSGEKIVFGDAELSDVRVSATVEPQAGSGSAALLLRVTGAALGAAAQRGYLAEWLPRSRELVWTRTDGVNFVCLARHHVATKGAADGAVELVAEAVGPQLRLSLAGIADAEVVCTDDRYSHGAVGFRVRGLEALFTRFGVVDLA